MSIDTVLHTEWLVFLASYLPTFVPPISWIVLRIC